MILNIPSTFFSWFGEFLIFDFFGHRAPLDGQHLRISETQDVFDIVGVFGIFKRLNMFRSYRWLSSYHLRRNVCSHRGRSARVYRSISPDLHPVEMFTQFIDLPSVRPVHRSSTLVLNRIIIIEAPYIWPLFTLGTRHLGYYPCLSNVYRSRNCFSYTIHTRWNKTKSITNSKTLSVRW